LLQVFVYGTLKPGESNYPRYCQGKVIQAQPASILACLYNLPLGYPAITPGNQRVEGFLLNFNDDAHLQSLDELEGYSPNQPGDNFSYCRQWVRVDNPQGDFLCQAWAYFMNPQQVKLLGGTLETSGCWSRGSS